MADCWCRRCVTTRRKDWLYRANAELRDTAARGGSSWSCTVRVARSDLPAAIAGALSPEVLDAYAFGELQLWLKRVRKRLEPSLRYVLTVDREGDARVCHVLLHVPRRLSYPGVPLPGVPLECRRAWVRARAMEVRPASPADVALLAPRCERVTVRASLRYGPPARPLSAQREAERALLPAAGLVPG